MIELQHPVLEPTAPTPVFERAPGEIEIHELHPREAAVIRITVAPMALPTAIHDALIEVERVLGEAAVGLAGPPFVRYFEWGPERLVAEIGFPVLRPAPAVGRVGPASLPGGLVASVVHVGPYETIATTYASLQRWLQTTGHGELGPMWEVYWTDPESEPDASAWRTEIVVPLR
jgi:effector-binding domain-containing protein